MLGVIIFTFPHDLFSQKDLDTLFLQAQSHFAQSEFEQAEELFTELIETSFDEKNWNLYTKGLGRLAQLYAQQQRQDTAMQILQQALGELDVQANISPSIQGRVYQTMGSMYFINRDLENARRQYQLALKLQLQDSIPNQINVGISEMSIGDTWLQIGKADSSLVYFNAAHKRLDTLDETHPDKFRLYNRLGAANLYAGYYQTAINWLQRVIRNTKLSEKDPRKTLTLSDAYETLGSAYYYMEDLSRAIAATKQSLSLRSNIIEELHFKNMPTYQKLGMYFAKEGDAQASKFYYDKIISVYKKQGNNSYAILLANMALSSADLGQYDQSISYYNQALNIWEKNKESFSNNALPFAQALQGIGLCYRLKGNFDQGIAYQQRAVALLKTYFPNNESLIIAAQNELAVNYLSKGEFEMALQLLNEVLKNNSIEKEVLASPSPQIGNTLAYKLAALTKKWKSQPSNNELLFEESMHTAKSFTAIIENLYRQAYAYGQNSNKSLSDTYAFYERALFMAHEGRVNDYQQAEDYGFSFMEQSRNAFLRNHLIRQEVMDTDQIPNSLIKKEHEIRNQLTNIRQEKLKLYKESQNPNKPEILAFDRKIFQLSQEYDTLINTLSQDYQTEYELAFNSQQVSISEVQDALPSASSALIEYFQGDSNLFIFTLTKDTVLFHRLSIETTFYEHLNAFIQNTRDVKRMNDYTEPEVWEAYIQSAYYLYQQLLEPVTEHLDTTIRDFIIIPDGLLSYIPFEALITRLPETKNANGNLYRNLPYLLQSHTVRYAYAASLLLNKQEKEYKNLKTYGGFAPTYNDSLGQLAQITLLGDKGYCMGEQETYSTSFRSLSMIDNIAKHLSSTNTIKGINAQESLFKAEASSYQILHLAMHAFACDDNPMKSGFVFAQPPEFEAVSNVFRADSLNLFNLSTSLDDGYLHAYEIYGLDLDAELVILSACHAGTGTLARGEGVMSLARSFRYAGCSNLMTSLWAAVDAPTANITERFVYLLKAGYTKDLALQQAKLEYLRKNPQTHPFFWANLVLIGDEEPIHFNTLSGKWLYLIGIILILGGLSFIFKKRYLKKKSKKSNMSLMF